MNIDYDVMQEKATQHLDFLFSLWQSAAERHELAKGRIGEQDAADLAHEQRTQYFVAKSAYAAINLTGLGIHHVEEAK
jgi:hypothetical protein